MCLTFTYYVLHMSSVLYVLTGRHTLTGASFSIYKMSLRFDALMFIFFDSAKYSFKKRCASPDILVCQLPKDFKIVSFSIIWVLDGRTNGHTKKNC